MSNLVQKPAPEFKTKGVIGNEIKEFSLSGYRGEWVVLFF
ncbi:MAG TPA: peroxiredoxin, partial [Bdellovibrionota bacterium]|nr:peroxiredoxin [Bdellovibrionota bacterium]